MTVICATTQPDGGPVWMAADAVACHGAKLIPNRKIHRIRVGDGTALLASAGRSALSAVARHSVTVDDEPDLDDDVEQDAWAQAIAMAITECCRDRGLVDGDRDLEGELLLAWRHRLWNLDTDLSIPVHGYAAIGSGAQCAIGAMWACSHRELGLPMPGRDLAYIGCKAAVAHIAGIVGPIQVEHT